MSSWILFLWGIALNGCFIYAFFIKLMLLFPRKGHFKRFRRCWPDLALLAFASSCFQLTIMCHKLWLIELWKSFCTESFLFDIKFLQAYIKRQQTHNRNRDVMILIFFKLIIHLARIGLLYSINDEEPSHLLESIDRVELCI